MQSAKLQFKIQNFRLFSFTFHFWRNKNGQSLIEILIAVGLLTIILPALIVAIVASREGKAQEGQRLEATALHREAEEAVRSVRERDWITFAVNNTYHPAISDSYWTLAQNSENVNGYTRQIVISDAQRDLNGQIVQSGGTVDTSTKKVVTSVSWTTPFPSSLQTVSYYQRYLANTAWTQTTDTDFNAGSHNNTQTVGSGSNASVELTQSVGGGTDYGNKFRLTATSSIGSMTTTGHKTSLRFTAQESKTVSAIRVYLQTENKSSPAYRYGIQTNNPVGDIPSGTWVNNYFRVYTATTTGWQIITLSTPLLLNSGTIYHIVVEPDGSPSSQNYIALRRSTPPNYLYPKTNAQDLNANTLFKAGTTANWATQNSQPIYELNFSDATFEGNPYDSSAEVAVFSNTFIGEKFTYTGQTQNAQSVTFYVRKQGTPAGNLDFIVQQIGGSTTTCTVNSSGVGTNNAPVTCTFGSPVTLSNGAQYRVYLRSQTSASGNDYRLYRLVNPSDANYNSINYDATNSIYTISTNGGSTWTDTSGTNLNWDVGGFFFTFPGSATYPTSGQFTSQVSPNFGNVAFNYITWSANTPAGTSVSLEISIDGGVYIGPFPAPSSIPLPNINGSTIRFRATLNSNGSQTPTLNDVSINYSP
ncbi:hypothetical protein A2164_01600 [Candidatus Curtissbacteria bacterium RBG_13_35_7]|uniref:DUF4082 domain-containing protein n=1 Tax=Candidatus Curtissbacteria bacterium RBG_13_35_7 TaxID=1797705 RepID=A0A1F5G4I8_9BACT|nr:MAG: hypothetical protein A2164_01600 [Candidatus Curtissbacteria bacterium RBG_13_35_7]